MGLVDTAVACQNRLGTSPQLCLILSSTFEAFMKHIVPPDTTEMVPTCLGFRSELEAGGLLKTRQRLQFGGSRRRDVMISETVDSIGVGMI